MFPWELSKAKAEALQEEAEKEIKLSIRKIPVVTCLLVLVNTLVFFLFAPEGNYIEIVRTWGLTPGKITTPQSLLTFVTHMFLHADILHLFVNMIILLQFGYICEHRIGRCRFALSYLACGIIAAFFYSGANLDSKIPCIGASGAVFGVLAIYALLFPMRKLYLMFGYIPLKVPSFLGILFVFLLETIYALFEVNPYIAHVAHIGGAIGGVLMVALFYPKTMAKILNVLLEALIP